MTAPPNDQPLPTTPPSPRPYETPTLQPLGSVGAVTAGPVVDGGNLDMLIGQTGGFGKPTDGTS